MPEKPILYKQTGFSFVLPIPRGLNFRSRTAQRQVSRLIAQAVWHLPGFPVVFVFPRESRWRVRTGFTPVSLFTGLTEIFCHPTPYAFLCGRYSVIFTVIFLTEWVYHSACILSIIIPWLSEKLTKKNTPDAVLSALTPFFKIWFQIYSVLTENPLDTSGFSLILVLYLWNISPAAILSVKCSLQNWMNGPIQKA